jgi:ABC-type uncharacterized transport system involved in gliding motility auxiliary subunit
VGLLYLVSIFLVPGLAVVGAVVMLLRKRLL